MKRIKQFAALFGALCWSWCTSAIAAPVTFYDSFAGNYDFVVTGGSLRTSDNDACAVTNSDTAPLNGIPASAGIVAAYLYWAGSGSTPDYTVTFEGGTISADRTFTEISGTREWFAGFADVTAVVQNKAAGPNGTYSFAGLTVDTGGEHCDVATVLAGWGLVVIYEDIAEPLRVINVYDGLQNFWGTSITLTPGNFRIPNSNIDGRFSVLTWEGDIGNSTSRNGLNEDLRFNGVLLTDALNPLQNQYNSTINSLGVNNSYGVDFDSYDISSTLSPGATSATTFFSTGQDRVLLTLQIISVTNTPVADLAIDKSHTGDFSAGQQGQYALSVSNNGPNNATGAITVTDTLPAGLSYVSGAGTGWTCNAAGQAVTCTNPGPLAAGNSLADITLTVNVAAAAMPLVTNTAHVGSTLFDNVDANNSDDDTANVLMPDLSTSVKSVLDLNGGEADPGDTLRYTVTINETNGAMAGNVSVTDAIDALLTGLNVVSIPSGAIDGSTPGTGPLSVSNINIAANGSASVVFDVTIAGSAIPGDAINNSAGIFNPADGSTINATAPAVIVSESAIPGSGIKPLYPYYANATPANSLRRVVPAANSNTTLTEGANTTLVMSPQTQTPLLLTAGNIQVPLCMQRSGFNAFSRDVSVTLDYVGSSSGTIGAQTQNGIVNSAGWQLVTFNINLPADLTLDQGTAIRLTVVNNSTGFGQRNLELGSNQCGAGDTFVALNAGTVINVDSLAVYDNAYPLGAVQPVYTPNSVVYLRALVSDPFGSFDINAASIEVIDALGVTMQPSTSMAMVNDSGDSTKRYEYPYTLPESPAEGNWTIRVTANEGIEGTVSDLGVGKFTVGSPNISLLKLASTLSDPINAGSNPKTIPGAIVEYQITVSNSGTGYADADSVVISDAIAGNLQLYLGNPSGPVQFNDGTPSSGLSLNFISLADPTDDIDFSNNGGMSFITPLTDADGFDATAPPVNYIRLTPSGQFNGSTGSGNPNFTVRFHARVR